MAYLTKDDLVTHIYAEIRDEITRADDSIVVRAIKAAVDEAKSYLSRYDTAQLFADAPVPDDENLKNKVKDLACWYVIKLCNPGIDLALMRSCYEDAIKWFEKVMKGQSVPDGWPFKDTSTEAAPPAGNTISWSSNSKRRNHF